MGSEPDDQPETVLTAVAFNASEKVASTTRCPRCHQPMQRWKRKGVRLESCPACKGTFINPGRMAAIYGRAAQPKKWVELGLASREGRTKWFCPAHSAKRPKPLYQYNLSYQDETLEIEGCRDCGSMWLDFGEGRAIRRMGKRVHADAKAAGEKLAHPAVYVFQLLTAFPVEVWNPTRSVPALTLGLMVTMTLLFVGGYLVPALDLSQPGALRSVGFIPANVLAGHSVWTTATYALFHANWAHLLSNLYFFWIFGDNVEDRAGEVKFLGILGAGITVGVLAEAIVAPGSATPIVGVSAGVSALMGCYVVLFPRTKIQVVWMFVRFSFPAVLYGLVWAGMQIGFALLGIVGVAWYAHLGGLVVGLAAGTLIRRRFTMRG